MKWDYGFIFLDRLYWLLLLLNWWTFVERSPVLWENQYIKDVTLIESEAREVLFLLYIQNYGVLVKKQNESK